MNAPNTQEQISDVKMELLVRIHTVVTLVNVRRIGTASSAQHKKTLALWDLHMNFVAHMELAFPDQEAQRYFFAMSAD